jgi:hypothetical protein
MKHAADILKGEGYTPSPVDPKKEGQGDGADQPKDKEPGAEDKDKPGASSQQQPAPDDIEDEDESVLLRRLAKKGINVSSLAEINKPPSSDEPQPTAEQVQAREDERRSQVRMYGLKEKLVTTTELDQFAADSQRPYAEVAFEAWKQDEYGDVKPEDRPTEAELADEFNEAHYQFAKEDDPKRIRAEKKLQKIAQSYMKQKYGKVYELDTRFNESQEVGQLQTSYQTTVTEAFSELGDTLSFTIKDGKKDYTYSFKFLPEDLQSARQRFTDDSSFDVFGRTKTGKADLINAIKAGLVSKHQEKIIAYIADTHAKAMVLAKEKGLRGIPPEANGSGPAAADAGIKNVHMKATLEQNKTLIA